MTRNTKMLSTDDETVLTYPAGRLDPDASLEAAIGSRRSYSRMDDVSAMTNAAMTLAAEVLFPSIGKLAFMARGRDLREPLVNAAGWQASCLQTRSDTRIDLLIQHPEKPGGYLLNVGFDRCMTEFGKRSYEALLAERQRTMAARGASTTDELMDEILGKTADWKAFMANPMVWRAALEDDRVTSISGTALDMGRQTARTMGGVYPQIDRDDVAKVAPFTALEKHPDGWWRGIAFEIRPQSMSGPDDLPTTASRGRSGLISDLLLMEILGDMARHNGFGDALQLRLDELAGREWMTFGDEHDACVAEAGLSAVHAAGGVIDASVIGRIAQFSVAMAGQDLERHLSELDELGAALLREGHIDHDTSFDCNDLRVQGYAVPIEGGVSLRNRTQNGHFRLDVTEDRVSAWRLTGFPDRHITTFSRERDALTVEIPPAGYYARDIRDMNGIIQSFASVACCMAEELANKASDMPAP